MRVKSGNVWLEVVEGGEIVHVYCTDLDPSEINVVLRDYNPPPVNEADLLDPFDLVLGE